MVSLCSNIPSDTAMTWRLLHHMVSILSGHSNSGRKGKVLDTIIQIRLLSHEYDIPTCLQAPVRFAVLARPKSIISQAFLID